MEKETRSYIIISGKLIHEGKTHPAGASVDLTEADAAHPLKYGVIEPADAPEELAPQPAEDGTLKPAQLKKLTNPQLAEYALVHHNLSLKSTATKNDLLFEIATAVKAEKKAAKEAAPETE